MNPVLLENCMLPIDSDKGSIKPTPAPVMELDKDKMRKTSAKAKVMTSTIKLQDKLTLKGIIIGSTIENLGAEAVHLYKGKTTTGNPIIIPAGGKFGVPKGHSIITVSNPSLLNSVKVSTLRIN